MGGRAGACPLILCGDAAEQLRTLDSDSVHCCVTSPPYFNLRDYGTPGQLGREATPEEYVEKLAAVFREVRRVLRPDGTLWLNLGDSYTSGGRKTRDFDPKLPARSVGRRPRTPQGMKPKDLIGIPWMAAFALRADGWYLRQDIIWHKPNAMPESVKDRCTKSHEHIFLLSKSARYYFDSDAIREPFATPPRLRVQLRSGSRSHGAAGQFRRPAPPSGRTKQAGCLDGEHQQLQGSAFRGFSRIAGGALHPGRVPGGRCGAGSVHGQRHHRRGGPAAGTAVRGHRYQPGLLLHGSGTDLQRKGGSLIGKRELDRGQPELRPVHLE